MMRAKWPMRCKVGEAQYCQDQREILGGGARPQPMQSAARRHCGRALCHSKRKAIMARKRKTEPVVGNINVI